MKKREISLLIFLIIISLTLNLLNTRITNPKEIDDVSPEIQCEQAYLEKSDILWVIPKYNNKSISENKEWCSYILSLNKTLGLHGVTHNFQEFSTDKNSEYLQEGITIFQECFNKTPKMFKPPQLAISKNNKELIKNNKLTLKLNLNQILHKVYHCDDTGYFQNRIIDII